MTDRYVDPSVAASGTGGSWAQAYKTLAEAVTAAAAGETIYFHNGTPDVITSNTTYTLAAGVSIISTSDKTNSPPTTYAGGATVSSTTSGVDIGVNGQGALYGVSLKAATAGGALVYLASSDDDHLYLEECIIAIPSNSTSQIFINTTGSGANAKVITRNSSFEFGATGSSIQIGGFWESDGDSFAASGTVPTTLITSAAFCNYATITGADLSAVSETLLAGNVNNPFVLKISNSKLHASVTPLGSTTSGASSEIYIYDSSYDNAGTLTGLLFYHENHLGSTTISTTVYANDALTYDGTNKCSWVVDGKAASNLTQPYQSPWLPAFNDDVSTSITPYFEVLRSGSTTAYTNALVWAEFEYRDTANSARMTLVNDRVALLATAANQTSSAKGAGDWTGEHASDNWFGKLEAPAAFTPDEAGYLQGRVCVAGDYSVYLDPQIRGLA